MVHNTSLPNLPLFNIHCPFPCRYRRVTLDFQCYHRTVYCDILWQQPLYRQYRANGGAPAPLSLICLPSGCPRTDFEFKLSGVCLFVHTYMHVCCLHLLPWGHHETGGSLPFSLNRNSIHGGIQLNKPILISTRLQSTALPPCFPLKRNYCV